MIDTRAMISNKYLFSDTFKKMNTKICMCDIGASGELGQPWNHLDSSQLQVIGFEPDSNEYEKVQQKYPTNKYFNIGLWSSDTVRPYYLTQQDYFSNFKYGTSSMFPPNIAELSKNFGDVDRGRVTHKVFEIKCSTLDKTVYEEGVIPDIIKIDTQGSECDIIKGAEKLLSRHAPIVTLETWTEEIYKGAPLSYEIMKIMDDYGYRLFQIEPAASRFYTTEVPVHCVHRLAGLELFYVKKHQEMSFIDEKAFAKHLAILELFGFRDYALFLMDELKVLRPEDHQEVKKCLMNNGQNPHQQYPKIRY